MVDTLAKWKDRVRSVVGPALGLAVLAAGPAMEAWAQPAPVPIEIEIRNTAAIDDDYIEWAPVPARIRLVPGATPAADRVVVLRNDPTGPVPPGRTVPLDGDVLFAAAVAPGQTATDPTLRLTLPGSGAWQPFFVAGRFRRPSSRDKDAVIEVRSGSESGALVHTHALMVRVRKDHRMLTAEERDRFLTALADLHFSRHEYEPFVTVHDEAAKGKLNAGTPDYWPDQSHRKAAFLAWHRVFLLQFERALQERFPDVALPYWRLSEPSHLFTQDFLGANASGHGEPVPALLAPSNPIVFWRIASEALLRFATDRADPHELSQFEAESQSLAFSDQYASFRAKVEGNPHNNGHNWVGPWMQNCMVSPRDPLFWVFHAEFDRLWAKWQWRYGRFGTSGAQLADYAPTGAYPTGAPGCDQPRPNNCIPLGHFLSDTMWPWDQSSGTGSDYGSTRPPFQHGRFPASDAGLWPAADASPTPADTIDYQGFAPHRLPMGFAYDDVPFGVAPPAAVAEMVLAAAEGDAPASVAALGRVLADREQPDEIRALALRHVAEEDVAASIERADAILAEPAEGGAELAVEAVELLATQMMFTNEGMDRHHEIMERLRDALDDPRRPVRVAAMARLAPLGDAEAVRLLVESLTRPEGGLFEPAEAIRTLSLVAEEERPGRSDRIALFRSRLDDADPEVRAAAVAALLDDEASQPRIVRMIGDPEQPREAREAALEALAMGVSGASAATVQVLADREIDPQVRGRAAAAVLFRLRGSQATPSERASLLAAIRRLSDDDLVALGAVGEALRAAGSTEAPGVRQ